MTLPALAVVALATLTMPAHADELGKLLVSGPLVRIETQKDGKLREGLAIADVNAPADVVFAVLTDFDRYAKIFPRIEEADVERKPDHTLIAFELDTPLVSTSYTNRYEVDAANRTMKVRQVDGDLDGTYFTWRVVPVGDGKSRIYYQGIVKNFSSVAQRLDDDQQTMTIGINVASLLGGIKAVKAESEARAKR